MGPVLALCIFLMIPMGCLSQACRAANQYPRVPENNPIGYKVTELFVEPEHTVDVVSDFFAINGADLILIVSVDYEVDQALRVTLLCKNKDGNPVVGQTVIVEILNENDNPPIFPKESYVFSISEDLSVNSAIGPAIVAEDADQNNIYYELNSYDTYATTYFRLSSDTNPVIFVNKALNYDEYEVIALNLTARDTFQPGVSPSHTATASITIEISDADDKPPFFHPCTSFGPQVCRSNPYQASINRYGQAHAESAGDFPSHRATTLNQPCLGYCKKICISSGYQGIVYQSEQAIGPLDVMPSPIHAEDGDCGIMAPIAYSIINGNTDNVFTIQNNGNLTMNKAIDTVGITVLQVMAYQIDDPLKYSVTTVQIDCKLKNLFPPTFELPRYNGKIASDAPINSFVLNDVKTPLRVFAEDRDFVDKMNPDIVYNIENNNNFRILRDGYILSNTLLLFPSTITLLVTATDSETSETTSTQVIVDITAVVTTAPTTTTRSITPGTGSTTTTTSNTPGTGSTTSTTPGTGSTTSTTPGTGTTTSTTPGTGTTTSTTPGTGTTTRTTPGTGTTTRTTPGTGTTTSTTPGTGTTTRTTPGTGSTTRTTPGTGTTTSTTPGSGSTTSTTPGTGTTTSTTPGTGSTTRTTPGTGTTTSTTPGTGSTTRTTPGTGTTTSTTPGTGTTTSTTPGTGSTTSKTPNTQTTTSNTPGTGTTTSTTPRTGSSTTRSPVEGITTSTGTTDNSITGTKTTTRNPPGTVTNIQPAISTSPVTSNPNGVGSVSPGASTSDSASTDGVSNIDRFYTVNDMAALGASLGVILALCMIGLGYLIYKQYGKTIRKKLGRDDGDVFGGSNYRSELINESNDSNVFPSYQNSDDGGTSKEQPESSTVNLASVAAVTPLARSVSFNNPSSETDDNGSDSEDAKVKSILTKDLKEDVGYKSVWFREDATPEVVVIEGVEDGEADDDDVDDEDELNNQQGIDNDDNDEEEEEDEDDQEIDPKFSILNVDSANATAL